jgi:hypothetical protein
LKFAFLFSLAFQCYCFSINLLCTRSNLERMCLSHIPISEVDTLMYEVNLSKIMSFHNPVRNYSHISCHSWSDKCNSSLFQEVVLSNHQTHAAEYDYFFLLSFVDAEFGFVYHTWPILLRSVIGSPLVQSYCGFPNNITNGLFFFFFVSSFGAFFFESVCFGFPPKIIFKEVLLDDTEATTQPVCRMA